VRVVAGEAHTRAARSGVGLLTVGALAVMVSGCGGDDSDEMERSKPPPHEATQGHDPDHARRRTSTVQTDGGTARNDRVCGESVRGDHAFPAAPVDRPSPEPSPRTLRTARQRAALLRRLREVERVKRLPHSRQAGCEKVVFPGRMQRVIWGPPPPRIVTARRARNSVTVRFRFARLPRSPGCRPTTIQVFVVSGKVTSPSFRARGGRFRVIRRTGSATVPVPVAGRASYTVLVKSFTLDFRPSREVRARVT
jgi:hypothetical protein